MSLTDSNHIHHYILKITWLNLIHMIGHFLFNVPIFKHNEFATCEWIEKQLLNKTHVYMYYIYSIYDSNML